MGRHSAGMMSQSPTECSVAWGSGVLLAAAPQSPWQEEDVDGDTGQILLLPSMFGHATASPDPRTWLPWCGLWGEKAPGAHHSRNAVEDPAVEPLSPRAPCPGSDVGCPWIQSFSHGHREQGARFWLPEHQRAARPDEETHKPAPS